MNKLITKLNLKGKITQKHSEEIEEIIQEKLFNRYTDGLTAGFAEHKRHIDEAIDNNTKFGELMDAFLTEAKDQHGNDRSLERLNMDRKLFIKNLKDEIKRINK